MFICTNKHLNGFSYAQRSIICAFRTFCCLLITNQDTFVMAVIRYVIGGATWLVRDRESDRETESKLKDTGGANFKKFHSLRHQTLLEGQ